MTTDDINARVLKFERTVATCLCILPVLFAGQCVLVAFTTPTFAVMFADFGSKLPAPTQLIMDVWPVWAATGILLPTLSVLFSRLCSPTFSVVFSTLAGLVLFLAAQFITFALLLPVFQLSAVSGGGL